MATKRSLPGLFHIHKRSKIESAEIALKESGILRTSGLFSPVVQLKDHKSEIRSCKFHPHGDLVMSSGLDKLIYIRRIYGEKGAVLSLIGHKAGVMDAQFSYDGISVLSCSQDENIAVWDLANGSRITKLEGHENCVNSVQSNPCAPPLLCSGSDDQTVQLWDIRVQKYPCQTFQSGYQVTSTCFNNRGDHIISAGVDNDIKVWDIRMNAIVGRMQGHLDMVSGISLSPCGFFLLSNSLDNTMRIWDLRPFAEGNRCLEVYEANQYVTEGNLLRCAWSKDGRKIAAGSSDSYVYIWDTLIHRQLYKLPGHVSSVNDVDFHPTEPIIVSASRCEHLFMHELQL